MDMIENYENVLSQLQDIIYLLRIQNRNEEAKELQEVMKTIREIYESYS
jgi:C4-type Zn-finger protein